MTKQLAVVTGAAGAIGSEICKLLDAQGYQLIAVDLNAEGLDALSLQLSCPLWPVAGDITLAATLERVLDAAQFRYGRCDVLVNNAAMVITERFEQTSPLLLRKEQEVNLLAPLLLTRALFPLLQASTGQVITIASLGALLPLAESPGYSASKFGLRGLMLALALRTPETGVRISTINPSAVDTPMLRHEALHGGSPLNFLGEPLSPRHIAEVAVRQLSHPRVETDVAASDGWMIRLGMLIPNLFTWLLPRFVARGRKGRQRYLQKRGLVVPSADRRAVDPKTEPTP